MTRIELFVWRFDRDREEILSKILEDDLFAAWFAKEPRRQSFHERTATAYLSQFPELQDFSRLAQTGNNALYIDGHGEIRPGSEFHGDKPSKALDFSWITESGCRCYASHKYTREGGGTQDNQFRDQRTFLRNFQARSTNDTVLFVICDGPYYDDTRMSTLQAHCRTVSPLSYAVHIEEVPELVVQLDNHS